MIVEQELEPFQKKKTRGPKTKLMSKRGVDPALDQLSNKTSKKMLLITKEIVDEETKDQLYNTLSSQLSEFLDQNIGDWKEEEEYKKFNAFGDFITCAKWNNELWISSTDIIKIQISLYRIKQKNLPKDRLKLEEFIHSKIRSLNCVDGFDGIIEESKSDFIKFLYIIGSIKTQKRQKIYKWNRVKHQSIHQEVMNDLGEPTKISFEVYKRKPNYPLPFKITSLKWYKKPKIFEDHGAMNNLLEAIDHLENNTSEKLVI